MSHTRSRLSRIVVVGVTLTGLLVAGGVAPAFAQGNDALSPDSSFTVTQGEQFTGAKSASGRLAQSDPDLLARGDAAVTPVLVKVDVDAVASYSGDIEGFAATSPSLTGVSIADGSAAIDAYASYVADKIAAAQAEASALIPSAKMLGTYVTAYGGFAMMIPANRAKDLLTLSTIAAVQSNELRQAATDTVTPAPTATPSGTPTPSATPDAAVGQAPAQNPTVVPDVDLPPTTPATDQDSTTFIGADKAWQSLGGRDKAGQGVIVGVLDTGIWPEHPMLEDKGLPTPDGGPWACEFGDGTLGAAFQCNDKLIGAYAFLDAYQASSSAVGAADYCSGSVCSVRDSEGHGTHTATTAVGDYVASAQIFGVERGPISGIAPGASVIAYRVCAPAGCFSSDSLAAVDQAIQDGVDVINYSISGSADPYDGLELAFLDAFAAGITVNSSAGNSGPGASTLDHASPWTTTVGASTFDRAFTSALILASSDGQTFVKQGSTLTAGVTDVPVVLPAGVAGYAGDQFCGEPFAAGSLTGKVVLCVRGGENADGAIGRVQKGYNASLGGATGMVLINSAAQDLQTDNHFLPAIQLDGPNDDLVGFITGHPDVTATWAQGVATAAQGDIMAAFSSRGPVVDFLKPDITAPGIQILAGNTPTPTDIASGPTGQLYQAIAGTSMSSPHAAGVSALVKAAHPTWTPGQIKSALMTSSVQSVVNVGGAAAGVFDRGAGSIRADRALTPGLTISESYTDFFASSADPLHRVDLNIASVYVDPLPGAVSTKRTVTNVSGKSQTYTVKATGADGLRITVSPSKFTIAAGKSRDITVILDGLNAEDGWHEGQITLTPSSSSVSKVVLPVAANVGEAQVSLSQTCDPTTINKGKTTTCTVSAANYLPVPVDATIDVTPNPLLQLTSVTSPAKKKALSASWSGTLAPALPPTVTDVSIANVGFGYIPLSAFGGNLVLALGDDVVTNINVPAVSYGGETYSSIGVSSNGYLVMGGGTAADSLSNPNDIPNTAAPNNVLAPLWTDLNPQAAGSVLVNVLTDGVDSWVVVEWAGVPTFSGNAVNTFQVWLQLGAEDIWYAYGANAVGDSATNVIVGAENRDGTNGIKLTTLPASGNDVTVETSPPAAGGAVTFDYTLKGLVKGTWSTFATLKSDALRTIPAEQTKITVK
jgi:subtilisin family serine protease